MTLEKNIKKNMKNKKKHKTFSILATILILSGLFLSSCQKDTNQSLDSKDSKKSIHNGKKETLFIGIDVSASFTQSKNFDDSLRFLSYYIYGHLNQKGSLALPKDLYVGGIGGQVKDEPQVFYPIHDFQDKTPEQIEQKLKNEFKGQKDRLTDFNVFFERIALMVKQKNLVLAPIKIILVSDGVPEVLRNFKGKSKTQILKQKYSQIQVSPLEYLARNISIRLLYTSPKVGNEWAKYVPRSRVKIWTVESEVMNGWKNQIAKNENKLWDWVHDNVDRKVFRANH